MLDNARYQRNAAVQALAKQLGITLMYLPSYSPNLNLIERLWKFIKRRALYSRYHPTLAEFRAAIEKTLNGLSTTHADQLKTTARQVARNYRVFGVTSCPGSSLSGFHQGMEAGTMPYRWPVDTDFALLELDVIDRDCLVCGRRMYICDHRSRHIHILEGPVELVCKLNHCPDPRCPGHIKTTSPKVKASVAPLHLAIGWDVFCWIGH